MIEKFEEFQKLGKDNAELAAQSFATFQKGAQAIAVEVADYSKKSFEEGSAAFEKLLGVKSLDKAIEVQTSYFKNAYEGFVAQATKLGTLYSDVAKDTYKPYEGVIAKATNFKV
jgi:hypothetical protein